MSGGGNASLRADAGGDEHPATPKTTPEAAADSSAEGVKRCLSGLFDKMVPTTMLA